MRVLRRCERYSSFIILIAEINLNQSPTVSEGGTNAISSSVCCRIYIVHDEVKDKAFELELSWVGEGTDQSQPEQVHRRPVVMVTTLNL